MARDSKYFKVIEKLLDTGYEAKDIAKITGIPRSTVYRIVDKKRTESKIDFKDLMEKDYLYKYQDNLKMLSKTIIECNEEIVRVNDRYDELERKTQDALDLVEESKHVSKGIFITALITCRGSRTTEIARLIQQRDRASNEKATLFNKGPVVYRINEYVKHKLPNVPPMLNETPQLEEKTKELTGATEEKIIEPTEISSEDQAILDEMDEE